MRHNPPTALLALRSQDWEGVQRKQSEGPRLYDVAYARKPTMTLIGRLAPGQSSVRGVKGARVAGGNAGGWWRRRPRRHPGGRSV